MLSAHNWQNIEQSSHGTTWFNAYFEPAPKLVRDNRNSAYHYPRLGVSSKRKVWCKLCFEEQINSAQFNDLQRPGGPIRTRDTISSDLWLKPNRDAGWMEYRTCNCLKHLRDCKLQPLDIRQRAGEAHERQNLEPRRKKYTPAEGRRHMPESAHRPSTRRQDQAAIAPLPVQQPSDTPWRDGMISTHPPAATKPPFQEQRAPLPGLLNVELGPSPSMLASPLFMPHTSPTTSLPLPSMPCPPLDWQVGHPGGSMPLGGESLAEYKFGYAWSLLTDTAEATASGQPRALWGSAAMQNGLNETTVQGFANMAGMAGGELQWRDTLPAEYNAAEYDWLTAIGAGPSTLNDSAQAETTVSAPEPGQSDLCEIMDCNWLLEILTRPE